ncbi:hypothetical protein TBLA_0A02760 [Henningerozyma blattae CBS 6284]|uniref:5-demethoxyubiquinone hydroxylase, mitochondrial n=1 Tax=Henningerozyma blattae (strain ATCC 34711 / CBS 6284 / DSM 70876 / NBRC 10599 / NRRL Y-10934 / UCD 77-7) TaxID=1071380 RepID=I2GVC2_HENB6|nr:hypothetical protein TBLA_0A02760 [Tetrapisispora blattae CBS 6284]CCH58074.1 hypothetical protein TBLA_0A02760 [Tetrapisispora blattae CBS 6284]
MLINYGSLLLKSTIAAPQLRTFSVLVPLKAKPTSTNTNKGNDDKPTQKQTPRRSKYEAFNAPQKAYLDRVIRVDQAGELGANYIYRGQIFVLSRTHPHLKPLLQHMWEQEVHHHNTFNDMQLKNRVRPSLITPLWKLGAIAMGAGTAIISPEAAMACTEAVETVIGNHYNEQLRCLMKEYDVKKDDESFGIPPEIQNLIETIKLFRDQELEHLDIAITNDSQKAVPYMLITEGIKLVCKGAIWAAERV